MRHGGKEYMVVKEGLAHILSPPTQDAPTKPKSQGGEIQSVFYNPIQQFNRDLSVLAIRAYGEHLRASRARNAEKRRNVELAKGRKRKRGEGEEKNGCEPKDEGHANPSDPQTSPDQGGTFTVLDALSATGLRALRYAAEIPSITSVVANDLSPPAVQSMKVNVEYNGLDKLIQPNLGDARAYMYSQTDALSKTNSGRHKKFDVIDLDPYGTAAPFMDAAVQAVKDGGLICVTCTDAGVWASTGFPEKTFALYGGAPSRGSHSHEVGLRLILQGLAASGARYGIAIEPLLSLSIDFYARLFVRVHHSPAQVKYLAGNSMLVYNCDSGCGAYSRQPLTQRKEKLDKKGRPFYTFAPAQGPLSGPRCEHCGFKTHISGPMWGGPLHNPHFIQSILNMLPGLDRNTYQTIDRIEGMLTTAFEEDLDALVPPGESTPPPSESATGGGQGSAEYPGVIPRIDPAIQERYPFYFSISALSKVLHTSTMPYDAFRGALRHLGYRSTRSHAKPNTIRTDAPWAVIWEITREWVRQKMPIKPGSLSPTSAGAAIMAKSRENLQKADQENQALSTLKRDIISATENVSNVDDLVTKIEAALYRSGSTKTHENPDVQRQQDTGSTGSKPSKPHPSTLDIVFDEALGRVPGKRLVRYQINPRANWGPLSKAWEGKK